MDKRSTNIMYEIAQNTGIADKVLMNKFEITQRQLDYSIEKINDWLTLNEQAPLVKVNKGYKIDKKVLQVVADKMDVSSEYILSMSERVYMIILLILSRQDIVNLPFLTEILLVSKNTILNDLIEVKKALEESTLFLDYVRLRGYVIQGDEWDKRLIILNLIGKLSQSRKGLELITKYLKIPKKELKRIRGELIEAEQEMGVVFTDQTLKILPLTMVIILRRIECGKIIDVNFHLKSEELADTREYKVARKILREKFDEVQASEKIFLTLHLLSSQSHNRAFFENKLVGVLTEKMKAFVSLFESQSAIKISKKEELIKKLLNHFIPAYYRITYKLTTEYQLSKAVIADFKNIYLMVKKSIKPLDDFLNVPIPDEELVYLSLILGGHILRSNIDYKNQSEIRAVVVCPQGVTISQLLEFELAQLFPEFTFYPAMSIRDFIETEQQFDVIFSTAMLESKTPLYVVSSEMLVEEKQQLRQKLDYLLKRTVIGDETELFLEAIKKHASIKNEPRLRMDISKVLQQQIIEGKSATKSLKQLLPIEHISVIKSVANWVEVVKIATEPLVKENIITYGYRNTLSEDILDILSYAVLYKRLALPHLGPEAGVSKLSMSLLIIKEGILTPNGELVKLVLVVTPIDKEAHLEALLEISDIVQNESYYQQLIQVSTSEEVLELINGY